MKKRWQKQTEEVYKKGLNDLDKHDGVVTPLEPGILECEVKWALGRITKKIASGGDGICLAFKCSFDEFVGEKVVSPSYSSTILENISV